jgi:hypothetical protein
MKLSKPLEDIYGKEQQTALGAQRRAQEIAFAPMVFQVSRLMVKFGILDYLAKSRNGATQQAIVEHTGLSKYAVQVLLEASLSIGTDIWSPFDENPKPITSPSIAAPRFRAES